MPRLQRLKGFAAGELMLDNTVLRELHAIAWSSYPRETGGVLLGHQLTAASATINHVIGPGPRALHAPTRFQPDHEWQAAEVASLWNKDRTLRYLGDWHTHPDGGVHPSRLDRDALGAIASSPQAQQPTPIMLILSLRATGTRLAAIAYQGTRIQKLRIHAV